METQTHTPSKPAKTAEKASFISDITQDPLASSALAKTGSSEIMGGKKTASGLMVLEDGKERQYVVAIKDNMVRGHLLRLVSYNQIDIKTGEERPTFHYVIELLEKALVNKAGVELTEARTIEEALKLGAVWGQPGELVYMNVLSCLRKLSPYLRTKKLCIVEVTYLERRKAKSGFKPWNCSIAWGPTPINRPSMEMLSESEAMLALPSGDRDWEESDDE